jgi:hypothetical protein
MAMPLKGRNQAREGRFEAFSTDAIRSLPEDDEGLADRLRIDPTAELGCAGQDGIESREEVDRVLAMGWIPEKC